MESKSKKCKICKRFFRIDHIDFIKKGKNFYEYNCYVEAIKKKKIDEKKIEKALKEAENLRLESIQFREDILVREKLTNYISMAYDEPFLPTFFREKLEDIFDGSFEGLTESISPEVLLDMWERKKHELDRINDRNKTKGKYKEGLSRIQYDLGILLRVYGEYKRWRDRQKIIEMQNKAVVQTSKINFENLNIIATRNAKVQADEEDFSIYLEDDEE